jgi:putative ABC transport system permease protein
MFANYREYFKIAARNLKTRSLRSWLTIFGIVIGVFLIITLLSLSEGIKETISRQLMSLGGNMVFVMPGDESNPMAGMMYGGEKLEKEDLDAIERTPGVEDVLPFSYSGVNTRFKEENKSLTIEALPIREGLGILQKLQGWSLMDGRWPETGRNEVVAGNRYVKKDIFKEKVRVGDEFYIKGRKFTVTGIMNPLSAKDDDAAVFMDIALYQDLTGEKIGTARMAMVSISEDYNTNAVAENIKQNLKKNQKRQLGSDSDTINFAVITSEKIQSITGGVLGVIQFVILAFASIAILVGGIGITNTMYTSVRERTREIGIMKSIGATNETIMAIFLFEASIIGFAGGIGGTVLGLSIAWIVQVYGQANPLFYFTASFSPWIIIFGLSFSFIVGCLAGILPARQAAKLRPIDALRKYE